MSAFRFRIGSSKLLLESPSCQRLDGSMSQAIFSDPCGLSIWVFRYFLKAIEWARKYGIRINLGMFYHQAIYLRRSSIHPQIFTPSLAHRMRGFPSPSSVFLPHPTHDSLTDTITPASKARSTSSMESWASSMSNAHSTISAFLQSLLANRNTPTSSPCSVSSTNQF
jgi:hypothetical protein